MLQTCDAKKYAPEVEGVRTQEARRDLNTYRKNLRPKDCRRGLDRRAMKPTTRAIDLSGSEFSNVKALYCT
jgi:hypothetical protein